MSGTAGGTLRVGRLTLDSDGYAVVVDGTDVFLTVSEFLLLRELARRPLRVIERGALWAALQGQGQADGTTELPSGETLRAIDRHVARLRKKLRDAGFEGIQTMRGVGYRLRPDAAPAANGALARRVDAPQPLRGRRAS